MRYRSALAARTLAGCAKSGNANDGRLSSGRLEIDRNFPDPAVIRGADGSNYVYDTQASVDGAMHNIQVARSNDLLS